MATQTDREPTGARVPLSRDRVFGGAIAVADEGGIADLTMRRLAQALGVEAMSLYYHVANKEEVLDGMVDAVIVEINALVGQVDVTPDWKAVLRERILIARRVLLRHPWAPGVIESRVTISPAVMRYFDGVLEVFRAGGFSYDLAHHAMHALGSRALGFTQELFDPGDTDPGDAVSTEALEQMAAEVPHLVGMLAEIAHDDPGSTLGWCDDQTEFEFGLDLILDGLERKLDTSGTLTHRTLSD